MSKRLRTQIALSLFFVLSVGAIAAGFLLRQKKIQDRAQIEVISRAAAAERADLLDLYRKRLERAQTLLSTLRAPALRPEWVGTNSWALATNADLAQFDKIQNEISNHVASVLTRFASVTSQAHESRSRESQKQASTQSRQLFHEFETLEQAIVKKRRLYAELYTQHQTLSEEFSPKDRPPPLPLFPAERALKNLQK